MTAAMRIIGIDPGTRCGWAVYDGTGFTSGTWDLAARRFEGGGMRFLRFKRLLTELVEGGVDMVAFEEVRRHMGTDAAHVYGGIVAQLQVVCEEHVPVIPYSGFPVASVKRTATGKGNADKAAMVAAANARWGLRLTDRDDNEADARWITETAREAYGR